jgi:hypothetical protein
LKFKHEFKIELALENKNKKRKEKGNEHYKRKTNIYI